jgi:O-antigen/teichoic acid export membrane protein
MILYVVLAGGAAAAALGKTLIYASVLGPAEFGMVSLALLVVAIGAYPATFGVQDGLAREVPVRRGRGEPIADLRGTALVSVGGGATVVGLLVTLVAATDAGVGLPSDAWWMGPFLTASVAFNIVLVDLQAREHSIMQAALLLAKSVGPAVIMVIMPRGWIAADVLALETALLVSLTALTLVIRPGEVRWHLDLTETQRLARIGLPFMGSSLAHNLAINLDRWAVQWVFGVAALGTYAFAMQAVAAGLVALNVSQMYLTPRWLRAWSSAGDRYALWRRARHRLFVTAVVCVLGAILGLLMAPPVVHRWWSDYEGALPLLPWVAAGAVAVALGFFDVFFLAASAGGHLVRVHLVAAAGVLAMLAFCAWVGASIEAFAFVFCTGRVFTLVLGWAGGRAVLRETTVAG